MRKIFLNSIYILILITILLNFLTAFCFAEGNSNFDLSPYGNDKQSDNTTISKPVQKIGGKILAVVRIVGTGIALIMITVIAIKYLLSSPGERADIKKSSIQYVIGAVIVFASANIIDILVRIIPDMVNSN